MTQQMNYIKLWSLILVTSLLVSCSFLQPEPIIETVLVKQDTPIVAHPKGLNLLPTPMQVVSYKNLDEFIAENKKRNGTIIFVAMDVITYENIALNTGEFARYIKQQAAIIQYYEEQANEE